MADQRKKCMSQWSDLPPELLSPIAESLDLVDLLGFRGVCKSWKSASSTASAHSSSAKPWFLLYGENNSVCQLVSEDDKKYTISLPELDGATCLASYQGWLLVYEETSASLFFLCPFSRAKIDIPNFPAAASSSHLSDHIAALSSPPTSQDCILCVVCRTNNNDEWQLNLLRRGADEWTTHSYSGEVRKKMNAIKAAAYHKAKKEFSFYDSGKNELTFSTENVSWQYYDIISPGTPEMEVVAFSCRMNNFDKQDMKNKLELGENVSLSICGTQLQTGLLVSNETITLNLAEDQSKWRHVKGVWIHPRFHQIPSNDQSW